MTPRVAIEDLALIEAVPLFEQTASNRELKQTSVNKQFGQICPFCVTSVREFEEIPGVNCGSEKLTFVTSLTVRSTTRLGIKSTFTIMRKARSGDKGIKKNLSSSRFLFPERCYKPDLLIQDIFRPFSRLNQSLTQQNKNEQRFIESE